MHAYGYATNAHRRDARFDGPAQPGDTRQRSNTCRTTRSHTRRQSVMAGSRPNARRTTDAASRGGAAS